jgi:hypothetical protein
MPMALVMLISARFEFDSVAHISNDLGMKQVVQEAIKIRLKINNNISINKY